MNVHFRIRLNRFVFGRKCNFIFVGIFVYGRKWKMLFGRPHKKVLVLVLVLKKVLITSLVEIPFVHNGPPNSAAKLSPISTAAAARASKRCVQATRRLSSSAPFRPAYILGRPIIHIDSAQLWTAPTDSGRQPVSRSGNVQLLSRLPCGCCHVYCALTTH